MRDRSSMILWFGKCTIFKWCIFQWSSEYCILWNVQLPMYCNNQLVKARHYLLFLFLSPWTDIQADHSCCKEIRGVRILLDSYQLSSVNVYSHANYWRHSMLVLFWLSTFILRGSFNLLNRFQCASFHFCGYFVLFCKKNRGYMGKWHNLSTTILFIMFLLLMVV